MPKTIKPGQLIPISFTEQERKLILDNILAEDNITNLLENAILNDKAYTIHISLEDLDDFLGFVAAESNHAKNKKLEAELDTLYEKLQEVEEKYEEE